MKKFLVGLLMVPTMAHAEFFTGNDLFNKMNGTTIDQIQAIGFVQGVFDVYVGVTFCPPAGVTAGQVSDMGKNYLANNPANRHKTAESLLNTMFKQAWPCQNRNSRGGA